MSDARLRDAVRAAAVPLDLVSARPWTPLVERLGGARVVLLGGLGLGAHESTRARAQLTARLIEDHGCHALLVETDRGSVLLIIAWDATIAAAAGVIALADIRVGDVVEWVSADAQSVVMVDQLRVIPSVAG